MLIGIGLQFQQCRGFFFFFLFSYSTSPSRGMMRGKKLLFCPLFLGRFPSHSLFCESEHTTLHKSRENHSGSLQLCWRIQSAPRTGPYHGSCWNCILWGSSTWCRDIFYPSPGLGFYLLFLALHTAVNTETQSHQNWPLPCKSEQALVPAFISGLLFLLFFVCFIYFCLFVFLYLFLVHHRFLTSLPALQFLTRKSLTLCKVLLLLIIMIIHLM